MTDRELLEYLKEKSDQHDNLTWKIDQRLNAVISHTGIIFAVLAVVMSLVGFFIAKNYELAEGLAALGAIHK